MSWYSKSATGRRYPHGARRSGDHGARQRRPVGSVDHMRIEHDSMGEVEVPDDARWGAQTQRAVDNFPISGEPIDRRLIARARGRSRGRRDRQRPARRGRQDDGQGDPRRGRRGQPRRLRRAVPDRCLPDRLGHVVEHEHERGARIARVRAARRPRRCTRTTTSTRRSRRTTCSRRRSTSRPSGTTMVDLLPRSIA